MPRGGHRPGSGAKPGNTNRLLHGRYSKRAQLLLRLYDHHPRSLDITAALIDAGIIRFSRKANAPEPVTHDLPQLIRFLAAVFFDRTHPLYPRFHQTSESKTPEEGNPPP